MKRKGEWLQTVSGKQFWPLDPNPEEIYIFDIAHALSNLCRFNGHCLHFYSVAQHSVLVSRIVPKHWAMWGLLHDAPEAYLVDLPRPVKRSESIGVPYKQAEYRLMYAVCDRFCLPRLEPPEVKRADDIVLCTEKRDLMSAPPVAWKLDEQGLEPLLESIIPMSPPTACQAFLERFNEIIDTTCGSPTTAYPCRFGSKNRVQCGGRSEV